MYNTLEQLFVQPVYPREYARRDLLSWNALFIIIYARVGPSNNNYDSYTSVWRAWFSRIHILRTYYLCALSIHYIRVRRDILRYIIYTRRWFCRKRFCRFAVSSAAVSSVSYHMLCLHRSNMYVIILCGPIGTIVTRGQVVLLSLVMTRGDRGCCHERASLYYT